MSVCRFRGHRQTVLRGKVFLSPRLFERLFPLKYKLDFLPVNWVCLEFQWKVWGATSLLQALMSQPLVSVAVSCPAHTLGFCSVCPSTVVVTF